MSYRQLPYVPFAKAPTRLKHMVLVGQNQPLFRAPVTLCQIMARQNGALPAARVNVVKMRRGDLSKWESPGPLLSKSASDPTTFSKFSS